MKKHPGARPRPVSFCLLGLSISVMVAASLIGCESPLRSDYAGRGGANDDSYAQSLVAHALVVRDLDGTMFATPTINRGVHELPRVDQEGPAAAPATTMAATEPAATNPSYKTVGVIGLAASSLNMSEPTADLSLQDAIARTVKHSLNIKLEAYNPAIRESQIIQQEAAFDPVLFGQSQWANNDDPSVQTPNFANGTTWQNQIGIRRLLPSGATVQAAANISYHDIDTTGMNKITIAGLNGLQSSYTANLSVQISQPLLRGFGTAYTQANIYLAQRDFRISLADFKKQVMTTVADVEEAYWNLVAARTNLDTLERLVINTEQTYKIVTSRIELDVTKASIGQTRNSLETRKAELVLAQANYRKASDHLKALMNDPELDINSNVLINPTDRPVTEPMYYSTAECVETALRQRPEMQAIRFQAEQADIRIAIAKNDLLPKVDLIAGLNTNGLDHQFDSAFGNALGPANSIDFNAGIKIEIPIGNRLAEATLKQRQLESRQVLTNLVGASKTIMEDVKNQLRIVLTAYEEIGHYDAARLAAAEYVQGILDIQDLRAKSPEFLLTKLDSQFQLSQAEQNYTQAIVAYNIAIMRLEQAKGTLLEYNHISLDRPPRTPADSDANKLRFLGHTEVTK